MLKPEKASSVQDQTSSKKLLDQFTAPRPSVADRIAAGKRLRTAVPRLEVYAQSFGVPIPEIGREVWRGVAHDLIERCVPLGKVPS
jgi:hypothetical protein